MAESKDRSKKQIEFAIRYQPEADSPDGIVGDYIRNNRTLSPREMTFQALRAFWLPFAYRAGGQFSSREEEVRCVLEIVYALNAHIGYICQYFGVERPDFLPGSYRLPLRNGSEYSAGNSKVERTVSVANSFESEEEEYDPEDSFPDD